MQGERFAVRDRRAQSHEVQTPTCLVPELPLHAANGMRSAGRAFKHVHSRDDESRQGALKTPPALVRSTLADTLLRLEDTQTFPSRYSDSENEDDAARRFEDRCEAARQAHPEASGTNEIPSPPTNPFAPLPLPSFMLSRSTFPVGLGATTRPHLRSLHFHVRPPHFKTFLCNLAIPLHQQ